MRKKIVAGNWKMNTNFQEGIELAKSVADKYTDTKDGQEVVVFPPYLHLSAVVEELKGSKVTIGAQNCHTELKGAYTGEISAGMLQSIGMQYCLVGHSERRAYFFEDDHELTQKLKQLLNSSIQPIFCCGESLEDRKEGSYLEVIEQQLELLWAFSETEFSQMVIAYEPVWAIGTGETATAEQAQEIHAFIRTLIREKMGAALAENTSILYGGSCKPSNANELFGKDDVDGGLIGGAALNADDFLAIVKALN
ncbi:MAG: triose-phosphate isomerase [Flavobacteriales bacterium]|nr:triose-phosphate isomerase [Flavobacteriales bacterium]